MDRLHHSWKQVPSSIRRPIVLVVGSLFIIAAALTGWLPGPGGIPLFLIGIAILATEFERAQRFRDFILRLVEYGGRWFRSNKILGTIILIFAAGIAITVSYIAFQKLR